MPPPTSTTPSPGIILGQGWNGDIRRIVQGRAKQGDMTGVIPTAASEIWGGQLVHPGERAAPGGRARLDQLAAHPEHGRDRDELPQLQDPDADALSQLSPDLQNDPLFNVPKTYTDNYHYILNVSPQVVEARTQIYSEFKAA